MFAADPLLVIVLVALVIDAVCGDPPWLYKHIPHPVAVVGKLIEGFDRRFNRAPLPRASFLIGLGLSVVLVLTVTVLGVVMHRVLSLHPYGWIVEALLVSTLIAFRGLYDGVLQVARALDLGLAPAREAVAHLVGRDPDSLDAPGIARAAIESTAENFSDGVVAPVMWFVLLGLPGILAYKTINTLDSMLGYRNPRYEYFGKAAARIDDVVNWLPARFSALLWVVAALCMPSASAQRAWRSAWRDAGKHRSVNAGWPEAAVAGALGFSLAGPRCYPDKMVDDAWMGDGRSQLSAKDVHATLRLYLIANGLLALALAVALVWR